MQEATHKCECGQWKPSAAKCCEECEKEALRRRLEQRRKERAG